MVARQTTYLAWPCPLVESLTTCLQTSRATVWRSFGTRDEAPGPDLPRRGIDLWLDVVARDGAGEIGR